ncbi:hypothetical protein [Aliivibrio fischeri]|uniref:LysM domain-containing protein n=1 Tax=Aliivibrio fischeri TaxID=668 RepID=A0A844P837_ALIFS|nr:hypothetical protein [Aliivibrio fischeri]MUK51385.1 hypothetical protein [Aliivibrio fischeri]
MAPIDIQKPKRWVRANFEPVQDEIPYIPELPYMDNVNEPPTLRFEYSFEVACSNDSLHKNIGCSFILAKTKKENTLGRWTKRQTEHGTRYTVYTAFDEPKRLIAQVASISMGISHIESVNVKKIDTQVADEGFIPIYPAVQLGERLGFPTEGFYYHIHNNKLIQEYKLIGNQRWSFYATRSMHHSLIPERGCNIDQTAILVFWKIGGKVVENQYIIYLDKQITRDKLDNLSKDWLHKHGVKLDITALLAIAKQPLTKQSKIVKLKDSAKFESLNHIVAIDPESGLRETWIEIAKQYDITPKELLLLNPKYDKDPMSLAVGHSLHVTKQDQKKIEKEPVYLIPPKQPQVFNQPLNAVYEYTDYYIVNTSIKAINNECLVEKDISIVNLKTISDTTTKFTDVIQVNCAEKIGLELEMPHSYLLGNVEIDDVLAKSKSGYQVGCKVIPYIELQVEMSQSFFDDSKKTPFVEIVLGPLSKEDITSKELHESLQTIRVLCNRPAVTTKHPITIKEMIKQYNSSITADSKFKMIVSEGFENIKIAPGIMDNFAMQTNIMVDFEAIGESEYITKLFEGCTQKIEQKQFQSSQKLAQKWANIIQPSASKRVVSFFTLLIYQTDFCNRHNIQNIVSSEIYSISFPVFFRTSPEDILFSILSNDDINDVANISEIINTVPKGKGKKSQAKKEFEFIYPGDPTNKVIITHNFKNVLGYKLDLRKLLGNNARLKLIDEEELKYKAEGLSETFHLTMLWNDCRRDIMQKQKKFYIVVEIRDHKMKASLQWSNYSHWEKILAKGGQIGNVLTYK